MLDKLIFQQNQHTILLLQQDARRHTRVWADFETVNMALEGYFQVIKFLIILELISMFEDRLRTQFPNRPSINYEITDLHLFLDKMTDVCCLV